MVLIYVWRRPSGEPFYVGVGSRERAFRRSRNRRVNSIRRSIEVAGGTVSVEIVQEGLTLDEALAEEARLIALFGRLDLGTGTLANMTDGGDRCVTFTPEVRARMREVKLGRPNPKSGEARRGRKATETQLECLALGRGPRSPETRAKLSVASSRHRVTPETRVRISAAKRDAPRGERGRFTKGNQL